MGLPFQDAYRHQSVDGGAPFKFNGLAVERAFAGVNYIQGLSVVDQLNVVQSKILNPDKDGVQPTPSSIFNKFTVFSYAPLNAGLAYQEGGHFIGYPSRLATSDSSNIQADSDGQKANLINKITRAQMELDSKTGLNQAQIDSAKSSLDKQAARINSSNPDKNYIAIQQSIRSNPTAANLIKWGAELSSSTPYGFQPFSYTDFIFCKNYGKIPNNRLITLRRYPFPIEDSVRIGTDRKRSAIPIAQAVTWFGGDTENSISKLGVFSWDIPWNELEVKQQDIEGNEILVSDVVNLLGGMGGKYKDTISQFLTAAHVGMTGKDVDVAGYTGYDKLMQEYQRKLYSEGPFWNRIYGPVNVIHKTMQRSRGIQTTNWNTQFVINFHYSFRSFNGLSPKIVALDLISNFMNLTYQDAQFLNQLSRYFAKTGVKFDPSMQEILGNILTSWGTTLNGSNTQNLINAINSWKEAYSATTQKFKTSFINSPLATALSEAEKLGQLALFSGGRLEKTMPKLISVKSALSDRAVGEWHLTVGNPMNPIFVMGDLLVTDTKMTFDEEMGPDDFPTGIKFTVTLKQGKPRDKTSIERMLNQGTTRLTYGEMATSAAEDTFGSPNNKQYDEMVKSKSSEKLTQTINAASGDSVIGRYRDRFRLGYGISTTSGVKSNGEITINDSKTFDDSLLLMYHQRKYHQNT